MSSETRPATATSDATVRSVPVPAQGKTDDVTVQEKQLNFEDEATFGEVQKGQATFEDDWAQSPHNARNWPFWKKWRMVGIVSFYTFVTPLGSSMMAPALPDIALHYGISNPTIIAMTLSVFLITFAIGPLLLGPLSEIYGRTWILHICNIAFLAANIGCAFAPTVSALIGLRVVCGFFGSAPIACGGGTISDLFDEKSRGTAMAMYSLGPLIGPAVGPIAGGFIAQSIGFKYVFIVITACAGVASILGIPVLRETYAPVVQMHLAQRSGDPEIVVPQLPHGRAGLRLIADNLTRPFILLTRSFVCFVLSLYMAFMYGIYYLMFATFPQLFTDVYHFSTGISGLAYVGLGIGFLASTVFGAKVGDVVYAKLAMKRGGKGTPEMRVPILIFGSFFVPVGVFWYGWSAAARVHWIMPIIGSGIFGFGMMTTFLPIQLYLVDTFTYAASAMAAASVFRSTLGFAFPLFGEQMFKALGYGGGNSLLAGLAIVLGIPFPVWLYYHGERIRAKSDLCR